MDRDPGKLCTGDSVGEYVIELPLGAGGLCGAYLARHRESGKQVCIKGQHERIRKLLHSANPFKCEIASLDTLVDAPDFPKVIERVTIGVEEYLVLSYIPGQSAKTWCESPPRKTSREIASVLLGIAARLTQLHCRNIVHCDVKPSNILLSSDGNYSLIDFGLAHAPDLGATWWFRNTDSVSGTKEFLSEADLMAWEPTPARDVYALGATAIDLLGGRTEPAHIPEGIDPAIERIIRKMIARHPCDRLPDGDAIREECARTLSARNANGS